MTADVRVEGTQLRVHVVEHSAKKHGTPLHDESSQAAHVQHLEDVRRRVQRLGRSPAVIELHNSIWRMLQIERRIARAARRAKVTNRLARTRHSLQQPWEAAALERLPQYQKLAGALKELEEATAAAEDEALLVLYGSQAASAAESASSQFEAELHNLLKQLLDLRYSHPNRITIAIYSENQQSLFQLARAYFAAATAAKMNLKLAYYTANLPPQLDEKKKLEMFERIVTRLEAQKPAAFLATAPDRTTGIILKIEGQSAYAMYENERGLHTFIEGKAVHNLLVDAVEVSFEEYATPSSLTRRGSITPAGHGERRRVYHRTEGSIEDRMLDDRKEWQSNSAEGLSATLKEFIDIMHERTAEKLIVE